MEVTRAAEASTLAPIVLFVYNRPWHTRQTVEALAHNTVANDSVLFIFSDAPKSEDARTAVEAVRKYLRTIRGFRNVYITERKENLGLARSIITGVTHVIEAHDRVIVLEDDMVSAPNFLKYMNRALDFYEDDPQVFTISGYAYPIEMPRDYQQNVYLAYRGSPWGWATWRDRWDKVDWEVKDLDLFLRDAKARKQFALGGDDLFPLLVKSVRGEIDAWSVRRTYAQFKHKAYTLHPVLSKIRNIGCDGSGVNCAAGTTVTEMLDTGEEETVLTEELEVNETINERIRKLFKPRITLRTLLGRIIQQYLPKLEPLTLKILHGIEHVNRFVAARRRGITFVKPNYLYFDRFDRTSVVVDVGCGYDADFSVHMVGKYGLKSYLVDPTRKHAEALKALGSKFHGRISHLGVAVAAKSGTIVFHESSENVSGSILADHNNIVRDTITSYEVEAINPRELLRRIGVRRADYLKLDIEGAEYELLEEASEEDFSYFDQIFVEFHHHCIASRTAADTEAAVGAMQRKGLKSFSVDNRNYLFYW